MYAEFGMLGLVAGGPGDYSGMPEISFPDGDPNAPDPDESQQNFIPIPSPPANFENISLRTPKSPPTESHDILAAQRTLSRRMSQAGATAVFQSCPGTGSNYDRYTGCLKTSTPMNFAVEADGTTYRASFNVVHQVQLYPNESSIDERLTITPVFIDPALGDITLEWRSNCTTVPTTSPPPPNQCEDVGSVQWAGTPSWAADGVDLHPVTAGIGHFWTGTAGVSTQTLTSLLTAITPLGGATTQWSDTDLAPRCDNIMGQDNPKPGCVFPSFTPTLTLNTAARPAAAALYWLLEEKLATHPGSKTYDKPLTRQADEAVAKANRAVICDSTFIPHPTGTSDDPSCDEYPFAKSRQSGAGSVSSGQECANFYAEKSGSRWQLKYDTNFPLPAWQEVCGRGSIPLSQEHCGGRRARKADHGDATAR